MKYLSIDIKFLIEIQNSTTTLEILQFWQCLQI